MMPSAEARLASDHRDLDALAEEAFAAFARADGAAIHGALDRLWMRLAVHIRAEHKVLFPALAAAPDDIQAILQDLRADHDVFMATLARLLQDLRKPGANHPLLAAAFAEMHGLLQRHNHLEETRIYPLAGEELVPRIAKELAFLPERYGK